ncbi:hypothetical protein BDV59DRAFT_153148 [Aspergillus ambiguus]|uniref:uncharacterized protein n=1 Tax=Aspergillus ambiguus TaxID=176160 RepID=UPI003CCD98DC
MTSTLGQSLPSLSLLTCPAERTVQDAGKYVLHPPYRRSLLDRFDVLLNWCHHVTSTFAVSIRSPTAALFHPRTWMSIPCRRTSFLLLHH